MANEGKNKFVFDVHRLNDHWWEKVQPSHFPKEKVSSFPEFFCDDRWLSEIYYIFEKKTHLKSGYLKVALKKWRVS